MLQLRDTRYNDVHLTFQEEGHKYFDDFGNTYKSVTTLLHDYAPKFDKDYWLKKKAKELHISEKKLEEQWNTITLAPGEPDGAPAWNNNSGNYTIHCTDGDIAKQ